MVIPRYLKQVEVERRAKTPNYAPADTGPWATEIRESLGVGRVPMWPLWIILMLIRPSGGPGPPLCPREPFYFLVAIMKMLGNKNDGTLYTPDDLSVQYGLASALKIEIIQSSILQMRNLVFEEVCPAETLGCFRLELSVIGFEEGPSVGTAIFRLQRLLDALGSRLWVAAQGPCPSCEEHSQRPVSLFLAKLLELLQKACAQHLSSA